MTAGGGTKIRSGLSNMTCSPSSAVAAETDDAMIELLMSEMKGKDITELIASGQDKLASLPSG